MVTRQWEPGKASFFLFGPRGTGKTTWIRDRIRSAATYDLLNPSESLRLNRDPAVFGKECETLDRASGDLSVNTADPQGYLEPSTSYPIGTQPSSLVIMDMDGDGKLDAGAGALSLGAGVLALRAGDGTGRFGPVSVVPIPGLHPGSYVFSVVAFDFDRDGVPDLAVGIYDCSGSRIVFLKGRGENLFGQSNVVPFPRARGMGLADFDADGDVDFAAVSATGELAVVSEVLA